MLLVIDVGNSNTVIGVYSDEKNEKKLISHWRMTTERRTCDELGVFLLHLLGTAGAKMKITGAIYSSVAPYLDPIWDEAIGKYIGIKPLAVSCELELGFKIGYADPKEVGADRLANVAAGIKKYGAPLVLVDLGTAITLDVIDKDKVYLGGAIAPGLVLSMESLFSRTAKLPHVNIKAPGSVIGQNTMDSILSGIVYGYAGLIDGLAERIFEQMGAACGVIATGGHASIIAEHSRTIRACDPWLTLDGLEIIYSLNQKK